MLFFSLISCGQSKSLKKLHTPPLEIVTAAQQTQHYLHLLKNKNVAIVANQTSVIFKNKYKHTHLVDSLLKEQISVKKAHTRTSEPL